jgi:hypothetical protein
MPCGQSSQDWPNSRSRDGHQQAVITCMAMDTLKLLPGYHAQPFYALWAGHPQNWHNGKLSLTQAKITIKIWLSSISMGSLHNFCIVHNAWWSSAVTQQYIPLLALTLLIVSTGLKEPRLFSIKSRSTYVNEATSIINYTMINNLNINTNVN